MQKSHRVTTENLSLGKTILPFFDASFSSAEENRIDSATKRNFVFLLEKNAENVFFVQKIVEDLENSRRENEEKLVEVQRTNEVS